MARAGREPGIDGNVTTLIDVSHKGSFTKAVEVLSAESRLRGPGGNRRTNDETRQDGCLTTSSPQQPWNTDV
jgi:hypothetical protein